MDMKMIFNNVIRSLFLTIIVWLGLFMGHALSHASGHPHKMRVTVFIHGTVASSLNILNPWQCSSETFNQDSFSARTVKKFRSYDGMNYDQIFGPSGFSECNFTETPAWYAARYVIPAYEACARCVGHTADIYKHAQFGWSGLLHNGARKQAGFELYHALCDYRDTMIQQYTLDPEIDIVAHSHGGNVALWLAQAEKEYKRGLQINSLIMLGTPMQKEMVQCIESPLFKTIILCYSQGDGIQCRDYFSTKEGKSYQRMADIVATHALVEKHPGLRRHDVACVVNNNEYHVTHTNMWMAGRSNPVLDAFDPLPLVVFMPALVWCLDHHPQSLLSEFHVSDSGVSCDVSLHPDNLICHSCKNCKVYDGKALRERMAHWSATMKAEWQSADDTSRHVVFNKKNIRALKHTLWG